VLDFKKSIAQKTIIFREIRPLSDRFDGAASSASHFNDLGDEAALSVPSGYHRATTGKIGRPISAFPARDVRTTQRQLGRPQERDGRTRAIRLILLINLAPSVRSEQGAIQKYQ
jgi:hypothetical protein